MKTKFIFIFLFFVCCLGNVFSQSTDWVWAKNSIGGGEGYSVTTDPSGNVFITGGFSTPTITFGSITLTNPNSGTNDVFIVKYDANGNALWAKCAGGGNWDQGNSVSADASGNVFVTGWFDSFSITFGSTTLNNTSIRNMFIVKYDTNGNVLWAKSPGGQSLGWSVSADSFGNAFVTGYFQTGTGGFDILLVKYDGNGNLLWNRNPGGAYEDEGCSVSANLDGDVFVTGYFYSDTANFGSVDLINANTLGAFNDIFVAKYDANGNLLWAKSAGGIWMDQGYSISADAFGNAFVTGSFQNLTIYFGSNIVYNNGGPCFHGCTDAFLVKYDANGNVLWAKDAGGIADDEGYCVSSDPSGEVYLTGGFNSSGGIFYGTLTPILTWPFNALDPMFFIKCDANGNLLCAAALASGGDDLNGVSADLFGNAYVTGDYFVDPFIVGSDTLSSPLTDESIFIAKYRCDNNVSVYEFTNENNFSISPNPSNGIFTLNSKITNGEIFIYNLLGEKIITQKIISENSEIDLSNQANGIYFVTIQTENKSFSQKIIVAK